VPRTQRITDHGKSRRCRLGHVISCVQSQLITWDMCTDDQCALMISIAPAVPPIISALCQCSSVPRASAHECQISATYQCLPVHISAHLSCLSVSPISASQCHLSVLPIMPPISASQCCLSVPVSAAYQ
ncbi:unnamed protein product, partial [Staurois parvus]